jgi:DNA primase
LLGDRRICGKESAVIGQDTIERVRERANIVELVGESVKLTRRGRSYVGLCPFHKEKTPSFHVNDERGFYHCFGCNVSGDSIKFVQETEGLSFMEAIRALAERLGIPITETGSEVDRRQEQARRRQVQALYDVGTAAAEFYVRMLKEHPLAHYARHELARRGLDLTDLSAQASETLAAFYVGYAPFGWDALGKHLRASGLSHAAAEKVGLLAPRKSQTGHYDRFRHRLMFAVTDPTGRIIAFSGRSLEEPTEAELGALGMQPAPSGDPPAKYVNSPESPIYRKREALFGLSQARQALRREEHCILVEGNFDVVSLQARGIGNVVAPLGTAFTLEQAKQIRRFAPRVTLLFDGDAAGQRAVRAAKEPSQEAGLTVCVATLPPATDPDDLVRAKGPEALVAVVRAASGLLEHLIDRELDQSFKLDDARGQAARIRAVTDLMAEEQDPAVRALAEQHVNRIAERLGIADARTIRALDRAVQQALRQGQDDPKVRVDNVSAWRARSKPRDGDVALQILGAILDYPELLDLPEMIEVMPLLEGDVAVTIAALRQTLTAGVRRIPEQVLAKLPTPIHPFALARMVSPRHASLEDAKTELFGNVSKLKGLELGRQDVEARAESERAARTGDFDRELELLREVQRSARQRRGL